MPLARLGEEEGEKEPLCLFLSFSDSCNGGLELGPGVLGELVPEIEDSSGNVAVLGVVAGEECEDDGQTRPTRLFLRSRHVKALGRRRSTGAGASAAGVGVEDDRRIAGYRDGEE